MMPDGLLHGALRLADHARADVVAIDTSAALAVDGVEAVFTAADVPGELRVGLIHKDWPVFIPEGGRTSPTWATCSRWSWPATGPPRAGPPS